MKFGFLAHPISDGHRNQVRAVALLGDISTERAGRLPDRTASPHVKLPLLRSVRSATGAYCEGEVRTVPHTAPELLRWPVTALDLVVEHVSALRVGGAEVIGLGGATSIVSSGGRAVLDRTGIPVTSGNSLTTYAAHQLLRQVAGVLERPPATTTIGVIGYPGSIGSALARLLLIDGFRVHLVCRRGRLQRERLLALIDPAHHGRVVLGDDVAACLRETRLVLGASSTGGVVDPTELRPGSVVIDVALPHDVAEPTGRDDVLVLDGGLVSGGPGVLFDDAELGLTENLNGCLAETMLLALEGRACSFSLGRDLDVGRVAEIGLLAERHGFTPSAPASRNRPVPWERVADLRSHDTMRPGPANRDPAGAARRRFARHINPGLANLYATHGLDRVFTRAAGCTLWTADGTPHLDMVAGYGCLNLGHNHPVVTERIRRFLDTGAPTFVQYVSVPAEAAELAERLCEVAPGWLERVFLSNSGTEAIEAALKLARAATGRSRLIYAAGSYHGKTLGALSVTGRAAHRNSFGPLLPDCVEVRYGDLDALESAVVDAAAVVLEPVLGEGGVVLPPPGYLRRAQELCRRAGALLIVDEVQTGLGRTGRLFACEHDGVEPDVLCLAKSLSGGLVPIGATLATAEVWDAAYGTSSGALAHTSTFGGGNLAAAAGIATLDVLRDEDLVSRSAALGDRLRADLTEVCAPFDFVVEVRGIGMMGAIAFDARYHGAARAAVDDLLTRLPGDLHAVADGLPDDVRAALRHAGTLVERSLGDLMCLRFVAELANRHQVLAFVTANRNQVVRLQPPLVLTEAEADRFVEAVHLSCVAHAAQTGLDWRPQSRPAARPQTLINPTAGHLTVSSTRSTP